MTNSRSQTPRASRQLSLWAAAAPVGLSPTDSPGCSRQTYDLILIDMDTVEERNLNRQSFTKTDIGLFKSEALAKRLAGKYQRPVQYSVLPVGAADLPKGIVVGCVDNGLARQTIAERIHDGQWWVDSGNGTNFGQVLIGNSKIEKLRPSFTADLCVRLPLPTIQQPALLTQVPRQRSCAEAVAGRRPEPDHQPGDGRSGTRSCEAHHCRHLPVAATVP